MTIGSKPTWLVSILTTCLGAHFFYRGFIEGLFWIPWVPYRPSALECEWSPALTPIPVREMRVMMDIPVYITEHSYNDVRRAHWRNFLLPLFVLRLDRALYAYMEKRKQKTWEGIPACSLSLPSFTTVTQAKQIMWSRPTICDVYRQMLVRTISVKISLFNSVISFFLIIHLFYTVHLFTSQISADVSLLSFRISFAVILRH